MTDKLNQGKTMLGLSWAVVQSVIFLVVLLLSSMLLGVVISLISPTNGLPQGPLGAAISEVMLLTLAVFLMWCLLRKSFLSFMSELGFKHARAPIELLTGFSLGTVIVATMFGALFLCGSYRLESTDWSANILPAFFVFFLAGFTEELIFRGFILRMIEKAGNLPFAIVVSSLLFGFAHILNPCSETEPLYYMIYCCTLLSFEAGLPLSGAYLVTRRLWLPVGFHWAWNFMEGTVFGVTVSGTDSMPSLLQGKISGDQFASGGSFGPEASIPFFLVGVVAGFGLLAWAYKKGKWQISSESQKDAAPVSQTSP